MFQKADPTRAALLMFLVFAVLVALGIAFSSCQREIGASEASDATKVAFAAVTDARRVLAERTDHDEYSVLLRAAVIAYDRTSLVGVVDTKVHTELGHALEYLQAAREAWQADLEGEWDPETYGNAVYWHARLPDVDLPRSGAVSRQQAIDAFLAGAGMHIERAAEEAGE